MNSPKLSSPTLAVVESISEREGVDPVDLRPPLHSVVDTEALDKVIESMSGDGYVEFQYREYQVRASSNGDIEVAKKDDNQASSLSS